MDLISKTYVYQRKRIPECSSDIRPSLSYFSVFLLCILRCKKLPEDCSKFLNIIIRLLFQPEYTVVSLELPSVLDNRQPLDSSSCRRQRTHTLDGEKAPVPCYHKSSFLQILRKKEFPAEAQRILEIILLRILLLSGRDQDAGHSLQIFQLHSFLTAQMASN